MLFNLSSKNNIVNYLQNVKKQHYITAEPMEAMCWIPTDSA